MQVQCVICDKIEELPDGSFQAKRLLNRRMHTHLCVECNERIALNTNKRHETGNFKLYKDKKSKKKHLTD